MKRMLFPAGAAAIAAIIMGLCMGEEGKPQNEAKSEGIALDKPQLDKGMPLMQALKNRKSSRQFSDQKLSKTHLSEILWAADGVNRDDGKRTAPSAMNKRLVDVYAVIEEGIYLYDPGKHQLMPVAQGDFRKTAGTQPFVHSAPLNLIYVADYDRLTGMPRQPEESDKAAWACLEAGHKAQNVYLYCASEGLAAVARAYIEKDKFASAAKLRPGQKILYSQTIGHPAADKGK